MEKGRDRRIFSLACAAGIGWLALYAAWTAIAPWGEAGQRWFSNVPYHLPIVAATAVALVAWHRGRVGSRTFWALLVATLALLCWWVIVRPLGLAGDAATLVGVAYPVVGLVLLGFLVATRFVPARRGTLTLRLFGLGILCTAVADGLYTHAAITHSYLPGDWIILGWQAEAVLLALAGVAALRVDTRSELVRWRPPNRLEWVAIVAGGAVGVALVLALDARDGVEAATVAAAGAVVALLLARAGLLLRDGFAGGELREASSGAYTPTYLLEAAGQHLRRARHLDESFAIALFDLGEHGTDLAARRIVEAAAPLDAVGRMDERRLAVVLDLTSHESAAAAADRLRAAGGGHTSASGVDDEHSRNVARVARELGIALDLDPEEIRLCYLGGCSTPSARCASPTTTSARPPRRARPPGKRSTARRSSGASRACGPSRRSSAHTRSTGTEPERLAAGPESLLRLVREGGLTEVEEVEAPYEASTARFQPS